MRHANDNAPTERPGNGRRISFTDLDDLKRSSEAVGWEFDFHQIEPGLLSVAVSANKAGQIQAFNCTTNRRIEILGTTPKHRVALVCPSAGRPVWTNGYRLGKRDVLILRPRAAVHAVLESGSVVQAIVPEKMLRRITGHEWQRFGGDDNDGAIALRPGSEVAGALRRRITAIVNDGEQDALAASIDTLIQQAVERKCITNRRSEAWRTICRARDYIESNLHRPIRIKHIGEYAAASVSKIERTFKHELRVTPTRYILMRRLHAVHHHLAAASNGEIKISDLARRYGFTHLGRFAASYRTQFDELPSESLQQAIPETADADSPGRPSAQGVSNA